MTKKLTFGKVQTYDPVEHKLDGLWLPPAFVWKEGRVRTSGSHPSECNVDTREFDVTVSPGTAGELAPNVVFALEYEKDDPGPVKRVTKFAPITTAAADLSLGEAEASISAAITVLAASSSPPPAGSSSSPPQQ